MTIRVVIADDQPMVRAGLTMLLSPEDDIEVVGQAATGEEALRVIAETMPDVAMLDLRMPGMGGAEATRAIISERQTDPDALTRVLIITTFDDDEAVYGALRAGASGFMLKHASPTEIADAVRRVAAGDVWLDPSIAGRIIDALRPRTPISGAALAKLLTPREQEVLRLMADGLSNEEIRQTLYLSLGTVKTHVARVLLKTGSRDRSAAVALAYRSGFVIP